jgi:hypothetical protein
MGFGLVSRLTGYSPVVTTNNYDLLKITVIITRVKSYTKFSQAHFKFFFNYEFPVAMSYQQLTLKCLGFSGNLVIWLTTQKTQFYHCAAQTTQKTKVTWLLPSQLSGTLTAAQQWAITFVHWDTVSTDAHWNVFTKPLPGNDLIKSVTTWWNSCAELVIKKIETATIQQRAKADEIPQRAEQNTVTCISDWRWGLDW